MSVILDPVYSEKEDTGEVRIKVKITNALDETLFAGNKIPRDQVRFCLVDAMVDTGAVRTILPPQVVQQLGLPIRGQRMAEYADGRKESVSVTGPLIVEIMGRDTVEEALVLGDEVLIGQTVLEKLDLLVDCANQRLVPNPSHPDQPVTKVKTST